ncbi:MAG TPA: glutathione synthase [Gammaproteobacteria bacterium]
MTIRLGVLMDPIESIKPYKDSTLAMLLAAQARGWEIWYMQQGDAYIKDGRAHADMRRLNVSDDDNWYRYAESADNPLSTLNVILMRLDPPYNMEYIHTTHLLQLAAAQGVLVVNDPVSLRVFHEKLYINWFNQLIPSTLVTSTRQRIKQFLALHQDIIIKPLDSMGGDSVFRIRIDDPNSSVIVEKMTDYDRAAVMVQRYIPDIAQGDKRILLIDGEPVPYALARIPAAGETRGNLAAGGRGEGRPLSARDREICAQVGPVLKKNGILFAGLDVIGDYLTEINITSPTCIRELDKIYSLDIAGQLMDVIAAKLKTKNPDYKDTNNKKLA